MGGEQAHLTKGESAKATLDGIMGAGRELNGAFLNVKVKEWEDRTGVYRYDGGISAW